MSGDIPRNPAASQIGTPSCISQVAAVWRSVCGVTFPLMPDKPNALLNPTLIDSTGLAQSIHTGHAVMTGMAVRTLLKRSLAGLIQNSSTKPSQATSHALSNTRYGVSALKKAWTCAIRIGFRIATGARIDGAEYFNAVIDAPSHLRPTHSCRHIVDACGLH